LGYGDSGGFNRYFDLDRWFNTTFPFIITRKPSKKEKEIGLDAWIPRHAPTHNYEGRDLTNPKNTLRPGMQDRISKNVHPTVKSIKLMSYLIMLGSREGDTILDPFVGSGTTCIAAEMLRRKWIGMDNNEEYLEIAKARLKPFEERNILS
jgi:DNA modification methylase